MDCPNISQYFGIFGDNFSNRLRADTPFEKLTTVIISFAKIILIDENTYGINFDGPEDRVFRIINLAKEKNPQVKIVLSLGDSTGSQCFKGASKDPLFPSRVSVFLQKYNFNGLDLDWESDIDKDCLNRLVHDLSEKLQPNRTLSLSVFPFTLDGYDLPFLKERVDCLNIMSYGETLSLKDCVENYTQGGFPIEKLNGGIETEKDYPPGADTLGKEGSIAAKARFARENGMGMMEWRLCNDEVDECGNPTYQGAHELYKYMKSS